MRVNRRRVDTVCPARSTLRLTLIHKKYDCKEAHVAHRRPSVSVIPRIAGRHHPRSTAVNTFKAYRHTPGQSWSARRRAAHCAASQPRNCPEQPVARPIGRSSIPVPRSIIRFLNSPATRPPPQWPPDQNFPTVSFHTRCLPAATDLPATIASKVSAAFFTVHGPIRPGLSRSVTKIHRNAATSPAG